MIGTDPIETLAQRCWREGVEHMSLAAGIEIALPVQHLSLEADWRTWLQTLFRRYVSDSDGQLVPFAEHQAELWTWLFQLELGVRSVPFIGLWGRGGAKSTNAEMGAVYMGALAKRRYGLYICSAQDQADDHVANIAAMLESPSVASTYPDMANRLLGKYGHSRGWRRNRLRTRSRFTIDALGLDTASRGAKLEEMRPDFMVLDDIDKSGDTPVMTAKKLRLISRDLLPAGTADCAILGVQNLIHPNGVFARIKDRRADFLQDRYLSGPIPALYGFAYEERDKQYVITAGEPSWVGQDLARCQALMNTIGLTSFRVECQHECEAPPGGIFSHLVYQHCTWDELPELMKIVVYVDPAVTNKDDSDAHGIQADALGVNGLIYRLWSWEERTTPTDVLARGIRKGLELGATTFGVETNQGGDLWEASYKRVLADILAEGQEDPSKVRVPFTFREARAGGDASKIERDSRMLPDYERAKIVHVLGTHEVLERALNRFPKTKPFDLVDAGYHSWNDLRNGVYPRIRNPAA